MTMTALPAVSHGSGDHDGNCGESKDGSRARLETRLLALRFAVSALLFAAGIVLTLLRRGQG